MRETVIKKSVKPKSGKPVRTHPISKAMPKNFRRGPHKVVGGPGGVGTVNKKFTMDSKMRGK